MDTIGLELYREWGLFGLVIIVCAFIVYDKFFKSKPKEEPNNQLNNIIVDSFNNIKENINDKMDGIDKRIDRMDERMDKMENRFEDKFNELEIRVKDVPNQNAKLISQRNQELEDFNNNLHTKAIEDIMRLGPKIYDLLNEFCVKINCTHLFIGSFHNGSTDLMGFPYIKMNIIREAYHPYEIVKDDHPFAPVYKDCDLSLLGKLPSLLVQKKMLHFKVDDLKSEIFNYDSLIGRRMIGMGIKQIALYGLFEDDKISGFIGCVRYDDAEMHVDELNVCVKELELVHNYSVMKK